MTIQLTDKDAWNVHDKGPMPTALVNFFPASIELLKIKLCCTTNQEIMQDINNDIA